MSLRKQSQLFTDTFAFYKQHFAQLIALAALPSLIMVIFLVITYAVPQTGTPSAILLVGVIVGMCAVIVLGILMTIALVTYIANPTSYLGVKQSYKSALVHFWPFLLTGFLSGLFIMLGFIVLIIPGIILSVWYAFVSYAVVLEGKRGMASLNASREYVRGHWFSVFSRFVIFMVALVVASVIVSTLSGILSFGDKELGAVLSTIAGHVFNIFSTPLMLIYWYFLYSDLKAVKSAAAASPAPVQQ